MLEISVMIEGQNGLTWDRPSMISLAEGGCLVWARVGMNANIIFFWGLDLLKLKARFDRLEEGLEIVIRRRQSAEPVFLEGRDYHRTARRSCHRRKDPGAQPRAASGMQGYCRKPVSGRRTAAGVAGCGVGPYPVAVARPG
jgi:hypothetical protein